MNLKKTIIITIDGPSGVGKSNLTNKLSKKFNFLSLNSGIMYRLLGLMVLEKRLILILRV